jgi:tRNA threonylcarbamoyladenosine biosynthesis protein TsaE
LAAEKKVTVNSEEETRELAREYAAGLKAGDVVVLNGNLGTGKTFFIREAADFFNAGSVSSPTFALVNEYTGSVKIYHFDFYRINRIEELYDIGFEDYLNDTDAIIFIEWGNLFSEILPDKRNEINIKAGDDKQRTFEFRKYK